MISNHNFLFYLFVLLQFSVFSQIPAGYYDSATGLSGLQLKTALYNIIKNHTQSTYANLYTCYQTTDNLPTNKVWDMYSLKANGTANYYFNHGTNTCGSYNQEGDCYNREHSTPASWFNDAYPMYTDLFNVYPTDGYVNNRRSNYPMAKVGNATWTSTNGSKVGTCATTGYSGTVFEPIDTFKGDFARTFLYMVTRYEDVVAGWPSNSTECAAVYAGNNGLTYKNWYITMLLSWCELDPVSQKEIDRNNAVYALQHNRNPYIDHPEYINLIWGGGSIIMVSSITVNSQNGSSTINTQSGTLQMTATVLPSNATNNTYTWSVKNPDVATISTSGLLTAINNGIDTVIATANDGSGVSGFKIITITNQNNGINIYKPIKSTDIYPIPAVDYLFVDFRNNNQNPDHLTIFDTNGREVINCNNINNLQKIDVSALEKGMYFITLFFNEKQITYKFIK